MGKYYRKPRCEECGHIMKVADCIEEGKRRFKAYICVNPKSGSPYYYYYPLKDDESEGEM